MTSIIDNRGGNTLLERLRIMSKGGNELWIASAFFSLDGLDLLGEALGGYAKVRILFGDDSSRTERVALLRKLREDSDRDLREQREKGQPVNQLRTVERLFRDGKIEARCYTKEKFHAKAYYVVRPNQDPMATGVIGSGNCTRAGLLQNVELNVRLSEDQTPQLREWYEERWKEAAEDVVTDDVLAEIRRQIDLYDPYVLYLKALYTWGEQQQEEITHQDRTAIWHRLDPHQEQGYQLALKVIEREGGAMICDGVGLGKSFIALALMEHYLRDGKKVLLIAPKNILRATWEGYLADYLGEYTEPYNTVHRIAMTDLGFDPTPHSGDSEATRRRRRTREKLHQRADIVVVDESHNFRSSSASRYVNLQRILESYRRRGKTIVLLTATPINTAYEDISNQFTLIAQEDGKLAGYTPLQLRRAARTLDKERPLRRATGGQLTLELPKTESAMLDRVLESVAIQRSRKTCKELAKAAGKVLLFPRRNDPRCIQIHIGPESGKYRDLLDLCERRFTPGAHLIAAMRKEVAKATDDTGPKPVAAMRKKLDGLKFAAFLTEQYRRDPSTALKVYADEVLLAELIFANVLKQLESSPIAFQGILQSLAVGLMARLKYILGDAAKPLTDPHKEWADLKLFPAQTEAAPEQEDEDDEGTAETGETIESSGDEPDAWLDFAIKQRGLARKLKDFSDETHYVDRWKQDIVQDLLFLREIHTATMEAKEQPDPKLACVLPDVRRLLAEGRRVLVFTQSQRTARYLEKELSDRLRGYHTARIDSTIETQRSAILHSFCPNYNPHNTAPTVPDRIDVLVSTDVLSEGVNLQETGAIVSFDIHWNPVRLIQRIGRVDRRLDPAITPEPHDFDIVNVLPAPEIERIIDLVSTVEHRTIKISTTLGLDLSFFKDTDPAGTLREFNAIYEGEITPTQRALTEYVRLRANPPDAATQRLLDLVPPGAFGVWSGAPCDGLFACFTMEAEPKATSTDLEKFTFILGQPVLALERAGHKPTFDAGEILSLLSGIRQGVKSAVPSDEGALAKHLKALRNKARERFADIGLPQTIKPNLVCWMELRGGTE